MEKKKSRRNGLEMPMSSLQILTYILFISNAIIYALEVLPLLEFPLKIILTIIFSTLFLIVIIIYYKLANSDPTDSLVTAYKLSENIEYWVNRFKVIMESQFPRFCQFCNSPVSSADTKHCMKCNRCTSSFDHHCKFINNCIGKVNYKLFFAFIIVVEISTAYMLGILLYAALSTHLWSITSIGMYFGILETFAVGLLNGYLIGFHVYLQKKNLSTFDYVKKRRAKVLGVNNMTEVSVRATDNSYETKKMPAGIQILANDSEDFFKA
jgi:DHHC palmitoyltransferase